MHGPPPDAQEVSAVFQRALPPPPGVGGHKAETGPILKALHSKSVSVHLMETRAMAGKSLDPRISPAFSYPRVI